MAALNPADFIGWNGERHRDALSHLLGCECPKPTIVSSIIDPADLIGWSLLSSTTKTVIVRVIQENEEHHRVQTMSHPWCVRPIIDLVSPKDQDNGKRPASLLPIEPAIVRLIMDSTDLIGWLFLKDKDDGERHCVQMMTYHGSNGSEPIIGCPTSDPADLIGWLFLKDQGNGKRYRVKWHDGSLKSGHPHDNGSFLNVTASNDRTTWISVCCRKD